MSPATQPRDPRDGVRLLVVDAAGPIADAGNAPSIIDWLERGDVLVVNDAATLPASLSGEVRTGAASGAAVEVRLAQPPTGDRALAVLMGAGDWRTRTEDRPAPPTLSLADVIAMGSLRAEVVGVSALSPRLVELRFDRSGDALLEAIYAYGALIQYAHLEAVVPLWSAQSIFATRPWAVEAPSAGRPLSGAVLAGLRGRGVEIETLTHAAGLSATGDPRIDNALPLPERYEIPAATAAAVNRARADGRRVIAVGTTVVRALEDSAARHGRVVAGRGQARLRLDASFELQVVSGVVSGMHAPGESHFELLEAFADGSTLARAHSHAAQRGYLGHEFGDVTLVLARKLDGKPGGCLRVSSCAPSRPVLAEAHAETGVV